MSGTVLYDYWQSSASYRVRIALNIAGVDYTAVSVDLVHGEQHSNAYLARNPQGLVPALDIDGVHLTQSLAILEYLNSTRDLGLLPADPAVRANVQALAQAIAVDIHPVCNLKVATYAAELSDDPVRARENWMRRFIGSGLEAVEAMLAGFDQAPYCCGDRPGLADICLIPQLYNAARWSVDITHLPRILGVAQTCANTAAFISAHPDAVQPTHNQTENLKFSGPFSLKENVDRI